MATSDGRSLNSPGKKPTKSKQSALFWDFDFPGSAPSEQLFLHQKAIFASNDCYRLPEPPCSK
jgi:hypothetical protein